MYFETIRAKDIEEYASSGKSIIIDLRDSEEYNAGYIPGAVNIPYEDMEEAVELLREYDTIILYCDRGNLSLLAARELSRAGLKNIYSVSGGYRAYHGYQKTRDFFY